MRHFTLLLTALGISGCVATATPPVPPVAPTAAVAPPPRPATPYAAKPAVPVAPTLPKATVTPAAPVTPPAPTGPIDARTGLHQSAVVAVSGNSDRGYSVFYRPSQTEKSRVDGAAAKLCGDRGVASSSTNSPGSGSAMPGVQIMVVKCSAA